MHIHFYFFVVEVLMVEEDVPIVRMRVKGMKGSEGIVEMIKMIRRNMKIRKGKFLDWNRIPQTGREGTIGKEGHQLHREAVTFHVDHTDPMEA